MLSLCEYNWQILAFWLVKTWVKTQISELPTEDIKYRLNSHNMIDLKKLSANPNGENVMNEYLRNSKWFLNWYLYW